MMKRIPFVAGITLLALILSAGLGLMAAYGEKTPETSWWLAIVFLWALTLFTYRMNMRFARDPKNHIRFMMLNNLFRMLLSILFVALVTYKRGKADFIFVAVFFISYFLFTFFEIVAILPNLRRDLKETPVSEDGRKNKGSRS
jgi:hypothetical protein